jgi:two-component system response regulator HydG
LSEEQPVRVHVIDDDEAHAESLADALEIDGHQCTTAITGRSGIERLSERSFDAVLTDLVMHDISGLVVVKECRHRFAVIAAPLGGENHAQTTSTLLKT